MIMLLRLLLVVAKNLEPFPGLSGSYDKYSALQIKIKNQNFNEMVTKHVASSLYRQLKQCHSIKTNTRQEGKYEDDFFRLLHCILI